MKLAVLSFSVSFGVSQWLAFNTTQLLCSCHSRVHGSSLAQDLHVLAPDILKQGKIAETSPEVSDICTDLPSKFRNMYYTPEQEQYVAESVQED